MSAKQVAAAFSVASRSVSRCSFVSKHSNAFSRSFASRRPQIQTLQPSAPVVRFTNDHYFDLSGTQFFSVSLGRKGPAASVPSDKSARVVLETPRHFKENTSEAKKLGISQYFVSSDPDNAAPSELQVSFKETTQSLKLYVDERRNRFFQEYPAGLVQRIVLQSAVTGHLESECEAILFDPFAQVSSTGAARPAEMCLLVRTGDGCWELSWRGQYQELYNRHTEFVQMIKKLKRIDGVLVASESPATPVANSSTNGGGGGVFASSQ